MKTRDMVIIAIFAALTAIGAFIKIQIGVVPFTFQFFFCALSGALLGAKRGVLSQLLYVGMGLIGIPVFTNGGGPTYIFQPTFGYLLGFIICAYIIGWATERMSEVSLPKVLAATVAGLMVVYIVGVPYLYLIVRVYLATGTYTFMNAVVGGFVPFIGPDLIMSVITASVAAIILPRLRQMGYTKAYRVR
ncbi:biotin transporter BioY [Fusibacter paucivorans]|uniref:Biotin transporter n=1 Tax=Fusibacter paucivorans TaxID=76009 RepID=A0ABS5PPC5_9FIRM|nr:biotin transporter BioY [Fusibacter paucivorans]MBS7527019.1 biotin transporter BioY [Fusibacter paucivorans]